MLKKRLIPKLQLKTVLLGGKERLLLVTTVNFDRIIEIGDPVSQAKIYEAQAADELIFIDIDSSLQRGQAIIPIIRKATAQIFMPITVGGGVQTLDDFKLLLSNGADKVSINTAAVLNPVLISEASRVYGAQCVVVSIDYRTYPDGRSEVFIEGGKRPTGLSVLDWAMQSAKLGAGEILLCSIDRDGTGKGLDLETLKLVSSAVSLPVIASGGCGLGRHFVEGFLTGGVDAVSAGTFFCGRDQNPMQARAHIHNAGIPIRILT